MIVANSQLCILTNNCDDKENWCKYNIRSRSVEISDIGRLYHGMLYIDNKIKIK
jgi:hypothetical protein